MTAERVLVVHNAYRHAGGEDRVVADEVALLRGRGHEVVQMARDNHEVDTVGRLRLAAGAIWSAASARDATELLRRFRPDVVHVHNTLPLISPSIYWACVRAGVPVVQTLHNFRLACPQAMLLRDGRVCERCVGRLPLPALRHGCYRDSHVQTAVVVGLLAAHRALGTWRDKIARYIALNEFCRAKFVQAGLPAHRIEVKPNFADVARDDSARVRRHFLFVGRLAPEKGVDVLARAWAAGLGDAGHALRIAGSGPDEVSLASLADVHRLGALRPAQVHREMRAACALVLPSVWYENLPRTLVEAFGAGLPVIASRIGALAELVEHGVTGLLFEPGNADGLNAALRWAAAHPCAMADMGRAARQRFDAHYTADVNYPQLLAIYRAAIADPCGRRPAP